MGTTTQARTSILRRIWRRPRVTRAKPLMTWYQSIFYDVANGFLRALFWLLADVEVIGLENVPRRGRLLVIGNHTSWLDPLLVGAYIPRRIVFMSKKENLEHPILRILVLLYGVFPVDRGNVDRSALNRTEEVLAAEGALGMFPEGTRSRSGEMRRARAGTALVAIRTNAPILPVSIANAHHGLFTPLFHLRRPRIRVVVGRPFKLSAPEGEAISKEMLSRLTDELMRPVAANLPPEQRGYYA